MYLGFGGVYFELDEVNAIDTTYLIFVTGTTGRTRGKQICGEILNFFT